MRFRLLEDSTEVVNNDEISSEVHVYLSSDGKAYIYDGEKLIEVDKKQVGKAQRGSEGWGKNEEGEGDSGEGSEDTEEVEDGEEEGEDGQGNGEEGGEDEEGGGGSESEEDGDGDSKVSGDTKHGKSSKKPTSKGGPGDFDSDDDYEDIELPDIEFDAEERDKLYRSIIDNQNQGRSKDIEKAERAEADEKAKTNASVSAEITANIKQLVSTQVRKYEVEKRRWWSDKHSDDDDQAGRRYYDDEVDKVDKPLCFLYLDASGSCSDAETQAVIKQVRDTFLSFTDKDPNKSQIDFEEYWFGTRVSKTRSEAGGGTNWGPLKEHISGKGDANEYKRVPDNIVIVTDGDLGGQHGGAKVYLKGAVWGLFVNSMDRDLCDPSRSDVYGAAGMKAWTLHVRGQKDTIKI